MKFKIQENDQRYFKSAVRAKTAYFDPKEEAFRFRVETYVNFLQIWGVLHNLKAQEKRKYAFIQRQKDYEEDHFKPPFETTKGNILSDLKHPDYEYCIDRLEELSL